MEFIGRFFQNPGTSYFLFGPRGTGKSTWIDRQYSNALIIDLLQPNQFRMFSARPERLTEVIEGNPGNNPIVIDEIQKVPSLLDVVHHLIETKKQLRFVLTGSSARKLRRTGVNLLAGRAILRTFHPFMAAELGDRFDLERAIRIGMLPSVVSSEVPEDTLSTYAALYLREEVQAEGIVRNIGDFSRFLETISFSHAGVLNTSEIARECRVGRKTVEGYIAVLEDLLLSYTIPVFQKRAKRYLTSHPKLFLFDTGVFQSLRPRGYLDKPEEVAGAALEGLVCQHLKAWIAYGSKDFSLYFWRTKSGTEVDFILYGGNSLTAMEVKNTRSIRAKDLRGLKAFKQDYPEAQCLFLYCGAERLKIDDIYCLPCDKFLRSLSPGRPIGF